MKHLLLTWLNLYHGWSVGGFINLKMIIL